MNNFFHSEQPIALNPLWTKHDFACRVTQITQQFQQNNVRSVALWFEDSAAFACVYLACMAAKVRVLLPPNLLPENQDWIAQNADLLIDDKLFTDYALTQKLSQNPPHFLPLKQLFDAETETWLKTSGSSGEAKIIKKTARQMWAEVHANIAHLPFADEEHLQLLGSVTVQHLYGLSFRIMLPLVKGWIMGREQLQYPEYLIAASQQHPTVWISSPTLLTHLNLKSQPLLQSSLIAVVSSGGVLPEQTAAAIRSTLPITLMEIYGSTETGVIAGRSEQGLWHNAPNSQIGVNEQGALWIEAPWIAGREQTADAVELAPEGFVLLGRIDRIVKLGDKRVSLVKIEQALLQHEWVSDCYIAPHVNKKRPLAWVALTEEGVNAYQQIARKQFIAQLKLYLAESVEKFAIPRFWRFARQLPRNSQSKISRADFEQVCLGQGEL